MLTIIELHSDVGHYIFNTELMNKSLAFEVKWNQSLKIWHLDLFDNTNNVALGNGIPLVLGYNICKQFNWEIGTLFLIDIDADYDNLNASDANDDDLGDRVKLVWIDQEQE